MSVRNPKKFWKDISKKPNWRDYILPNRTDKEFDMEGFKEAQRLYYFFDNNDVIVDYGCGIGRISKYCALRAKKVIGLDINLEFIKIAKKNNNLKNLMFKNSDTYDKSNFADFIYCMMVFQHNDKENRIKMISNIFKMLRPGGVCLIQFPKQESNYYQESPFVHKFKEKEIKEYARAFSKSRLVEGNLINYANPIDKKLNHEYFLIAEK